ncbi:hypothetical protein AMECASPLE_005210 [Ameca splendens]|uniref:Uncharacterized protein n=1 Tax=Ameca splendens TaxID=208324 RepID=A0ABV0Z8R2_9TELE
MDPVSPHRSTASPAADLCSRVLEGGRDVGWANSMATPGPAMDYLHPPVPTFLIYPHSTPSLFFGSTHGGQKEGGVVVFQQRCAGQPAFIRMNQRGDKISPVTKLGYEI